MSPPRSCWLRWPLQWRRWWHTNGNVRRHTDIDDHDHRDNHNDHVVDPATTVDDGQPTHFNGRRNADHFDDHVNTNYDDHRTNHHDYDYYNHHNVDYCNHYDYYVDDDSYTDHFLDDANYCNHHNAGHHDSFNDDSIADDDSYADHGNFYADHEFYYYYFADHFLHNRDSVDVHVDN